MSVSGTGSFSHPLTLLTGEGVTVYCHSPEKYILERTSNLMIQGGNQCRFDISGRQSSSRNGSHELLEKVGMEILKAALPCQEIPLIACSYEYFHFDIEKHLLLSWFYLLLYR